MEPKNNSKRGGARPNSGRPRKDPNEWQQISVVLKRDTVEKIRAGAGGDHARIGQFLQDHLDKYPVPSRELYLHLKKMVPLPAHIKPTLGATWAEHDRALRKLRREERAIKRKEREWAKLTPKQRADRKAWTKILNRLQREEDAKKAKAAKQAAA